MDNYDKALIEQALVDKRPQMGEALWQLLYDRQNALNGLFEFSQENIEMLNSINNWLRDIESKAVDHVRGLVVFLKSQQVVGKHFLVDYEVEYELQLWAPKKFAHLKPLEGNPFFTLHTTLPDFKKYINSEANSYDWEIDDDSESLDWIFNENHNEYRFIKTHPLNHQEHCWLFHELYHHTLLSWQDFIDIEEIWIEVVSRHQHISPASRIDINNIQPA